ncbi:sigma factor, partial [Escherichia coli]|uniref:sigma factor n=1 Tax=Escherichia coli TaxID=562 RepID=UPI002548441F
LHALARFDASQGASFATYAVQRIRGSMLDELRSRDWAPRSVRRQAREMAKVIGELEQSLSRSATESEIAQALNIDVTEYRQALL